jgi:putative Ca2+/H+ antiporter (TMEM165/GDT1 family)
MDAFLTSAGLVALGEIGDKTQLLAILLAARFGKPVPIIAGIFAATILNHTVASAFGVLLAQWLSGPWFQGAVGASFLAMAAWALIPDKMDETSKSKDGRSVFLTTLVSFFLVEIGDKTQIVTMLLAARFENILLVAAGTTTGMMIADIPAVLFGERAARLVPLPVMRRVAAALFAALGLWILVSAFFK